MVNSGRGSSLREYACDLRPLALVMDRGVVFGVVVPPVVASWRPVKPELALCFATAQPV